jgi:hypothetical protein
MAKWTNKEIALLTDKLSLGYKAICPLLPRHTYAGICHKAQDLHLVERRKTAAPDPIIQALFARRKELGLSIGAPCFPPGRISRYERGEDSPTLKSLHLWARALGLRLTLVADPDAIHQHQVPWQRPGQ